MPTTQDSSKVWEYIRPRLLVAVKRTPGERIAKTGTRVPPSPQIRTDRSLSPDLSESFRGTTIASSRENDYCVSTSRRGLTVNDKSEMPRGMRMSKWRGLLFSFLVPGAGQFFAGQRALGVAWHFTLLFVRVAALLLPGLFIPYGLFASFALLLLWFSLWVVMVIDSHRPVPEHGRPFILVLLVVGILVWWGERFLVILPVTPFKIPGDSMQPTFEPGDRILVVRDEFNFARYRRGDVVVFHPPESVLDPENPYYVKRIVGLPEETVALRDSNLFANGEIVREPAVFREIRYATAPQGIFARRPGGAFHVPEGNFFMIGDNSSVSYDSRHWGPLPRENIVGRAIYIWWPTERAGRVE